MRTAFRAEALDLLPELDAALLAMELEPHSAALVNRVFRAMHTIKGSGATAGFTHLARFAHGVEEAFDLARAGKLPITSELIDCGLKACDVIREILDMEDEDREATGEHAITEAVSRLLPGAPPPTQMKPHPLGKLTAYEITFKPNTDLFRNGTDPLSLLDELRGLGHASVTAHIDALPPLAHLDPESCYLTWQILVVTERGQDAIRDVFLFVEDDSRIDIHTLPSQPESIAFLLLPQQEQPATLHRLTQAYLAIADASLSALDDLAPYQEAMHHLAAAARCSLSPDLEEAALLQTRILARIARVDRPISAQDTFRLHHALDVLRHKSHSKEGHA